MRAILARLRGSRAVPTVGVSLINASTASLPVDQREVFVPGLFPPIATERDLGYTDAVAEALKVCERLGIEVLAPLGAGDLVRHVYGQGWLACEARLASPDMADLIYRAINTPAEIIEVGDRSTSHQVRAVQQIVTYGVKSEPH